MPTLLTAARMPLLHAEDGAEKSSFIMKEPLIIIARVSSHRAARTGDLLQHLHRRLPFGVGTGFGHSSGHRQSVPVLHQYMPQMAQLKGSAGAFAIHPRIRIGGAFMRVAQQ